MVSAIDAAHWRKGDQMRHKAIFIAGVAVGFVAGARAGRGAYDKIVGVGQQVAAHPKVQQATSAAQAKATELAKTAAAKAPDYAKNAASSAVRRRRRRPHRCRSTYRAPSRRRRARSRRASAARRIARRGGSDPAGTARSRRSRLDDVDPDGNLVYPAEGSPSVNGTLRHYNPEAPEFCARANGPSARRRARVTSRTPAPTTMSAPALAGFLVASPGTRAAAGRATGGGAWPGSSTRSA